MVLAPMRRAPIGAPVLLLGLVNLACDGDPRAYGRPDAGSEPRVEAGAKLLPGCAEYCERRVNACGATEGACLSVCSNVNRPQKLRCSAEHEAVNLCYAAATTAACDSGAPEECLDEIGRFSSCLETDGGDSSGCVQAFGGGTCRGDFVDGRTAQKTCYPGVPIPPGCISVRELLALRGFPDSGAPATHPDGTLVDSAVVCCPP